MKATLALFVTCMLSMTSAFHTPLPTMSKRQLARSNKAAFGISFPLKNSEKDSEEVDMEVPTAMFSGDKPSEKSVVNIPTGQEKSVKWTDTEMQANTSMELSWWAW